MILQLDLNSPRLTKWRIQWMRIVSLAQIYDVDLYKQLTGLPDELPILSQLIPPQNDRIEGIEKSWFARRQRGDIPVLS